MFLCAQLNEDDIVVTVSRLAAPVERPNIIPLAEWRDDILGWRYNRQDGQFYPPEPVGEPEPEGGE